jgi:hypothetical protein
VLQDYSAGTVPWTCFSLLLLHRLYYALLGWDAAAERYEAQCEFHVARRGPGASMGWRRLRCGSSRDFGLDGLERADGLAQYSFSIRDPGELARRRGWWLRLRCARVLAVCELRISPLHTPRSTHTKQKLLNRPKTSYQLSAISSFYGLLYNQLHTTYHMGTAAADGQSDGRRSTRFPRYMLYLLIWYCALCVVWCRCRGRMAGGVVAPSRSRNNKRRTKDKRQELSSKQAAELSSGPGRGGGCSHSVACDGPCRCQVSTSEVNP